MAIEVEIPIYADEPSHFLPWAVDEIMPILLGLDVGILMGHIFIATVIGFELRSSLRNFESQNEYGYKPCIKRRFQNAETLQSRNQTNSS